MQLTKRASETQRAVTLHWVNEEELRRYASNMKRLLIVIYNTIQVYTGCTKDKISFNGYSGWSEPHQCVERERNNSNPN